MQEGWVVSNKQTSIGGYIYFLTQHIGFSSGDGEGGGGVGLRINSFQWEVWKMYRPTKYKLLNTMWTDHMMVDLQENSSVVEETQSTLVVETFL